MTTTVRWTTADLEAFPDTWNGTRYEIIDGELYVSAQPSLEHQFAGTVLTASLFNWSQRTGHGLPFWAPGLIFADDDNVVPDLIWLSHRRLRTARGADGKLHEAPELAVEILSPGTSNERRDREIKLKLYGRRGVDEYWLVDPIRRSVERFRREGSALRHVATLRDTDTLESPLLPGFSVAVGSLFYTPPEAE